MREHIYTIPVNEAFEKSGDDCPFCTLFRKLEENGLVASENDTTDKRNKLISLTEKGKNYTQITASLSNELIETFYKGFNESEKEIFVQLINRIESNFSQ